MVLSSKERAALAAIGRVLEREDPRLARQLTADPREVPGPVEPSPGRPTPAAPVPDPLLAAGAPAPAAGDALGDPAGDRTDRRDGDGGTGEEDDDADLSAPGPEITGILVLTVLAVLGLVVGLLAGRPGYALIGAAMGTVGGLWWRCLRRRPGHGGPCGRACGG
ncbi:hypothetical protein GCM10023215_33410 [Pseudonocardia yuanmonensis]|uniref:DUF3040 family protein n=1 Tax=Pseudonocardia yuanmonensis TaxID=1095914 RepID=A0ABP8WSR4_9PSEU